MKGKHTIQQWADVMDLVKKIGTKIGDQNSETEIRRPKIGEFNRKLETEIGTEMFLSWSDKLSLAPFSLTLYNLQVKPQIISITGF